MATQTTTHGRGNAAAARFGRTSGSAGRSQSSAGRFGRSSSSAGRGQSAGGRMSRNISLPSAGRRSSTSSSSRSLPIITRRSHAKKTGLAAAIGAITSALPSRGSSKGRSSAKKPAAGGAIALAAAAVGGMAFKNRDKLSSMRKNKQHDEAIPMPPASTVPPAAI